MRSSFLKAVSDTTNKASVSIRESGVKDTEKQTPVDVKGIAATVAVSIGEDNSRKDAEMEDIAKTTTEATAMIGHEEAKLARVPRMSLLVRKLRKILH